jgi:predicted secreted hydrolase
MQRRQCLSVGLSLPLWPWAAQAQARLPLQFPRDLGSHPDFAIEWWYITGRLLAAQREFGFQITFFRSRVPDTQGMTSAFAAKQLIFAHAAVTDVANKNLLHDQRIARTSGNARLDLATASEADTDLSLGNWSLKRAGNGNGNGNGSIYQAQASGSDFSFQLKLRETQALLLQGDQGWSRKGPETSQASYYYSLPQLQVSGQLSLGKQTLPVQGQAWLDHEWSNSLMHPQAVGWDWIGMNLDDGSALTAFRLRTKEGDTLWAGGSLRARGASSAEIFAETDVIFTPQRHWKSPASGTSYPVQWSVQIRRVQAKTGLKVLERYTVNAVIDKQELDSRQSTGAIYWEGLSELLDSRGAVIGRGYLEMTGYARPLRL